MTTGLVWLKYADWGGTKPWRSNVAGDYDDAHTRAGRLRSGVIIFTGGGGFVTLNDGSVEGDWRLPTKTEFTALINGTDPIRCSSGSCDLFGFLGVQSNYYWTSTTTASISYAWSVHMDGGQTVNTTWKGDLYYVWPVRDGN